MKVSPAVTGVAMLCALSACGTSTTPHAGSSSGAPSSASPFASAPGDVWSVLQSSWQSYARTFIRPDGSVVDPMNGDRTTSEGESYAMLRAVWMDDRTTFDAVWRWTQEHLWSPSTQRLAWLWINGAVQDSSSAADADQDIALALLFAAHRWRDSAYMSGALQAMTSVWDNDVTTVDGTPYLVAGNWAGNGDPAGPVLNPSYFAPYAYRLFAVVDSAHDWQSLVQSSYRALAACSAAPLSGGASVGLPPNWCVLDRNGGGMRSYAAKADGDDYGYDAFRVMWRVALDALWNGSPQARAYLNGQGFLRGQWAARKQLAPMYAHGGGAAATYDDATVYGGDIGAFLGDSDAASAILRQKLLASLQQQGGESYFGQPQNYYEQNWVWFGIALATGRLPNLAAGA